VKRINGLKPNQVTEKGLARTFQNIRLFHNMTVLENVMIGCHCRMKAGILGAVLKRCLHPTGREGRGSKKLFDP
jgi:branched-chain amino acid transport system ATP-binding protein